VQKVLLVAFIEPKAHQERPEGSLAPRRQSFYIQKAGSHHPGDQPPETSWGRGLPDARNGIMARSSAPTFSTGCWAPSCWSRL